ncbi:hypothetical protein CALCODRAFT_483897 [Calocera cornea HHB12733]|uniref:Uncharacterized protein n=1 Tax=Calocera cornea HHB12733 TaxID=1353952 RepID=A0A165FCB4_9BASI|nr:hypothetical protein CALCODRAFT_483897 [Calocera cornea HHB12733]
MFAFLTDKLNTLDSSIAEGTSRLPAWSSSARSAKLARRGSCSPGCGHSSSDLEQEVVVPVGSLLPSPVTSPQHLAPLPPLATLSLLRSFLGPECPFPHMRVAAAVGQATAVRAPMRALCPPSTQHTQLTHTHLTYTTQQQQQRQHPRLHPAPDADPRPDLSRGGE